MLICSRALRATHAGSMGWRGATMAFHLCKSIVEIVQKRSTTLLFHLCPQLESHWCIHNSRLKVSQPASYFCITLAPAVVCHCSYNVVLILVDEHQRRYFAPSVGHVNSKQKGSQFLKCLYFRQSARNPRQVDSHSCKYRDWGRSLNCSPHSDWTRDLKNSWIRRR